MSAQEKIWTLVVWESDETSFDRTEMESRSHADRMGKLISSDAPNALVELYCFLTEDAYECLAGTYRNGKFSAV